MYVCKKVWKISLHGRHKKGDGRGGGEKPKREKREGENTHQFPE